MGKNSLINKPADREKGRGGVIEVRTKINWMAARKSAVVHDRPMIVQWSTPTCGPCKKIYPLFESLSHLYKDLIFVKVGDSQSVELSGIAKSCAVAAFPTFQMYHGEENSPCLESFIGGYETQLRELVQKYSICNPSNIATSKFDLAPSNCKGGQ